MLPPNKPCSGQQTPCSLPALASIGAGCIKGTSADALLTRFDALIAGHSTGPRPCNQTRSGYRLNTASALKTLAPCPGRRPDAKRAASGDLARPASIGPDRLPSPSAAAVRAPPLLRAAHLCIWRAACANLHLLQSNTGRCMLVQQNSSRHRRLQSYVDSPLGTRVVGR